jgi:hypothetical protein
LTARLQCAIYARQLALHLETRVTVSVRGAGSRPQVLEARLEAREAMCRVYELCRVYVYVYEVVGGSRMCTKSIAQVARYSKYVG